jgi:hypothetical protein
MGTSQLQPLLEALDGAGLRPRLCVSPDGSRILVLRHGGRVLGLFAPGCESNFFWTNPALSALQTARDFAESSEWHNSGGDRTWLAPEMDFFFSEYPSLEKYGTPIEFDPGDYSLEVVGGYPRLVNRFRVRSPGQQRSFEVEIVRQVSAAPNLCLHAGLDYAGYTLTTTLRLLPPIPEAPWRVGLWNLLQMPHGGELLVSTSCRAEVRVLFGNIVSDDLEISERLVRYRMRARGQDKLGVGPAPLTGRSGYVYTDGDEACLIVRNFHVDPSGEYVDIPWLDPPGPGAAFQACNIDSGLGSFSELEYHAPAIVSGSGATFREDTSVVWAFRGSPALVQQMASNLVSHDAAGNTGKAESGAHNG